MRPTRALAGLRLPGRLTSLMLARLSAVFAGDWHGIVHTI